MNTVWHKVTRSAWSMLLAVCALILVALTLQSGAVAKVDRPTSFPVVLAEYQAWHGLVPTHTNPPYTSTDPLVISRHIQMAQAMGISGFVVDWYGPPNGISNDTDRAFIDQATAELIRQSEARGFKVALMYDEGTISNTEPLTTLHETHAINDVVYARRYFTSSAYLSVNGQPALFVFPYPQVDPNINWSHVRSQLGITVTLLDEDPNPRDQRHDLQFDGFYAWVQPPAWGWRDDGSEWGHDYLAWFYNVMAGLAPTYTSRVAVGGVWPGFDDSTAPWGQNRYMWRRCGQTWQDTWQLAHQYNPPYVMIDTWNDFEEGSDIEFGIGECQLHAQQQKTLTGHALVFTNLLSNTGKFSDSFTLSGNSSHGWPIAITPTSTLLLSHTGIMLTLTLAVPVTAPSGVQDLFTITATSHLSSSVYSRLVNTATVLWGNYLPVIRRD